MSNSWRLTSGRQGCADVEILPVEAVFFKSWFGPLSFFNDTRFSPLQGDATRQEQVAHPSCCLFKATHQFSFNFQLLILLALLLSRFVVVLADDGRFPHGPSRERGLKITLSKYKDIESLA
jgi:hypothetical protein